MEYEYEYEQKQKSNLPLVITVAVITLAIVATLVGLYLKLTGKALINRAEYETKIAEYRQFDKLIEIQNTIEDSFLWEYDKDAAFEAMYRGVLESLGDQYSRYMNEEEWESLIQSMNSSFTGVGVVFMQTEEGFYITEVIKDGPADTAGVKAGDYILKVDGEEYDYSDDMAVAIRGEAGTTVNLLLKRGEEEIEFNIVRGKIETGTIESSTLEEGKIGYIRIKSFGDDTANDFMSALSSLESQKVGGLIIDLRNNGGGLFDAGVRIADRLLPTGLVSYAEDKHGNRANYNSDGKSCDLPMVVLINEATASTSEMLAAALKDNGITLVGITTYGKGIMQETRPYPDGTAVSVTVRQFFSPLGNQIHGVGVEPTEVVPIPENLEDTQLQRAIDILLDEEK